MTVKKTDTFDWNIRRRQIPGLDFETYSKLQNNETVDVPDEAAVWLIEHGYAKGEE